MISDNMNVSPVNSVPPVILVVAILVVGAEAVLQAGENGLIGGPDAIGWRIALAQKFGFYDTIFEHMRENRDFAPANLLRLLTYPLVHASFMHAFFAGVMILALGKKVAEAFSVISVLVLLVLSTFAGSLVYGLADNPGIPLIGAYPAVYGLIGAYSWILWLTLDKKGKPSYAAFQLIGFLIALQLMWKLLFGGQNDWIADLAGFTTGFALSFVVSPDAGPRLRKWVAGIRG